MDDVAQRVRTVLLMELHHAPPPCWMPSAVYHSLSKGIVVVTIQQQIVSMT